MFSHPEQTHHQTRWSPQRRLQVAHQHWTAETSCLGLTGGCDAASAIVAARVKTPDLQESSPRDPRHGKPQTGQASRVLTMSTCWAVIGHPDLSLNRFLLFRDNGILVHHAVTQIESPGRQLIHREGCLDASRSAALQQQTAAVLSDSQARHWSLSELSE